MEDELILITTHELHPILTSNQSSKIRRNQNRETYRQTKKELPEIHRHQRTKITQIHSPRIRLKNAQKKKKKKNGEKPELNSHAIS
jgi:hypothetical protein